MSIGAEVRDSAYKSTLPKMNRQERKVWEYLVGNGKADAWEISESTGQLITSTRRCLHDLRGKWVQEAGKVFCKKTGVDVTAWVALPIFDFDETGQGNLI